MLLATPGHPHPHTNMVFCPWQLHLDTLTLSLTQSSVPGSHTWTLTWSCVLRGGGSSGESSGSESSWGGTVSFVEPTYRPSNLSVGSRGHLKIDYSWSWNRLDDFVRTTSPRQGAWYDYRLPKGSRPPQVMSNGFLIPPRAPFTRWESYLDPVAG